MVNGQRRNVPFNPLPEIKPIRIALLMPLGNKLLIHLMFAGFEPILISFEMATILIGMIKYLTEMSKNNSLDMLDDLS